MMQYIAPCRGGKGDTPTPSPSQVIGVTKYIEWDGAPFPQQGNKEGVKVVIPDVGLKKIHTVMFQMNSMQFSIGGTTSSYSKIRVGGMTAGINILDNNYRTSINYTAWDVFNSSGVITNLQGGSFTISKAEVVGNDVHITFNIYTPQTNFYWGAPNGKNPCYISMTGEA